MRSEYFFTERQTEIIIGSMLGDGYLSKQRTKNANCYFAKNQTIARREYLEWTNLELAPFSSRLGDCNNKCNGKIYRRTNYATISHPLFTSLRKKWYPEGKKIVPTDLELTPLSLAVWFCDDGYNNLRSRSCKFATYCFSPDDYSILMNCLAKMGIESYLNGKVISVRSSSYKVFIDIITPHVVWKCFDYKLKYRDSLRRSISDHDAAQVISLQGEGNSLTKISKQLGISVSAVSNIVRGNTKRHFGQKRTTAVNNSSGYTGIRWEEHRKKWKASVQIKKRRLNGRFDTFVEAVTARDFFYQQLKFSS